MDERRDAVTKYRPNHRASFCTFVISHACEVS